MNIPYSCCLSPKPRGHCPGVGAVWEKRTSAVAGGVQVAGGGRRVAVRQCSRPHVLLPPAGMSLRMAQVNCVMASGPHWEMMQVVGVEGPRAPGTAAYVAGLGGGELQSAPSRAG